MAEKMDVYAEMDQDVEDSLLPGSSILRNNGKDKFAALVFYIHCCFVIAIAIFLGLPNIGNYNFTVHRSDYLSQGTTLVILTIVMGGVASLASVVWLNILQRYASNIIHLTLRATIASLLISSVMSISFVGLGGRAIGLANLIMAVFVGMYYLSIRHRIPFAAANLSVASKLLAKFPQLTIVAYTAIVGQVVWVIVWIIALVGVWQLYNNNYIHFLNISVFVLLLSLYWTLQVLKNIVHCTASGTVGEWWFTANTESNAVERAKTRALTKSFGSICLGSFIVAILSSIRTLLAINSRKSSNKSTINACLECFVQIVEKNVLFFNKYAYCQVSIYGKDFKAAGGDTMQLFREKGWTTVINDSLVSSVLSASCLIVGVLTGGISSLWLYLTINCSTDSDKVAAHCDTFNIIVVAFVAFSVIGYAVCSVVSSIIDSIVSTIFVCFAEDPVAVHITNSEEYLAIVNAWRQYHPELLTHSTFSTSVSYA